MRIALAVLAAVFGLADPSAGQLAARPAEEWIKLLDSPERQVTKDQLDGWMAETGFVRSEKVPQSEAKWFLIYRRK